MDGRKLAKLVFPVVHATPNSNVQQLLLGEKLNKNSHILSDAPTFTHKESIQRWLSSKQEFVESQHKHLLNQGACNQRKEVPSEMAKVSLPPTPLQTKGSLLNDVSIIMPYLPAVKLGGVQLVSERLLSF